MNSDETWDATSSTTFFNTRKLKIIVDPGCKRELLLKSLRKNNIQTEDISCIFLTHYQIDHGLFAGLFQNAIFLIVPSGKRVHLVETGKEVFYLKLNEDL